MKVERSMIKVQIDCEQKALKPELLSYLKRLHYDIGTALADVEAGNTIDSHLLQHATGISERLGRWNFVRRLLPYIKED